MASPTIGIEYRQPDVYSPGNLAVCRFAGRRRRARQRARHFGIGRQVLTSASIGRIAACHNWSAAWSSRRRRPLGPSCRRHLLRTRKGSGGHCANAWLQLTRTGRVTLWIASSSAAPSARSPAPMTDRRRSRAATTCRGAMTCSCRLGWKELEPDDAVNVGRAGEWVIRISPGRHAEDGRVPF